MTAYRFVFISCLFLTAAAAFAQKVPAPLPCTGLSAQEQQRIAAKAKQFYPALAALKTRDRQRAAENGRTENHHVLFGWPMQVGNYDDIPGFYNTTNYWDMSSVSNVTRDWICSNKTYDGHNGTDITIWPFWWRMKDNNYVYAVAGADGIVIDVDVSHSNDDNCTLQNITGNRVTVLHSDSSTSSYLHLKFNSAVVAENDVVVEGQRLASIGSSGRTTYPHLHFQVADKNGNNIEPYVGANPSTDCNTLNNDTWWKVQKPHYEPRLNRLMTHYGVFRTWGPDDTDPRYFCREMEVVKARNNFSPGDSIYFGIFLSDIVTNSDTDYDVLRPDGTVWQSGSYSYTSDSGQFMTYRIGKKLPSNAETGTWAFKVTFRSQTEVHYFTVNCTANYTLSGETGSYGYIASNAIESTSPVTGSNKVLLQAGSSIVLKPGFSAVAGSTFKARIRDCNFSE